MIRVTREQMKGIDNLKSIGISLFQILKRDEILPNGYLKFDMRKINKLTDDEIASVWLGIAEIEPEYVSFDEAMMASEKGKLVDFHSKQGNAVPVSTKARLKEIYLSDYSLRELREGKFTIGRDNNEFI